MQTHFSTLTVTPMTRNLPSDASRSTEWSMERAGRRMCFRAGRRTVKLIVMPGAAVGRFGSGMSDNPKGALQLGPEPTYF